MKSALIRFLVELGLFLVQPMLLQARTVTVYYQGLNSTQVSAAKLAGKEGFVSRHTGEQVSCSKAIDCLINLAIYPEIDEVELLDPSKPLFYYLLRPYTLAWFMRSYYIYKHNTIRIKPHGEKVPDGLSLRAHAVRVHKINIGQEGDIAEHKKRVEACHAEFPDEDIVLYGMSRGALTTFIGHALHRYAWVKAVVLEGCPSALPDIVKTIPNKILRAFYRHCVRHLCAHDPKGISALSCVDQFPLETPVLFITSEKDKLVPASCTLDLVDKLVKAGHKHVYCLVLKNSSHTGYSSDDPEDALNYQHIVHAFYKKYGIEGYNETYAAAGEKLLEQSHIKI